MYAIAELLEIPDWNDPKLERIEVFDSLEEALSRSDELLDLYHEEYGEDYYERANSKNMFAYAGNSDVTWRLYISEIKTK